MIINLNNVNLIFTLFGLTNQDHIGVWYNR